MNFSYSIVMPEDGLFGKINPVSGEWNGMMRMIIEKRCDVW